MEAFKLFCLSNLSDFSWLAGFSMLVTAFGMCAIPFCKQALLLTGLMSSIGMSMGVLDTGKSTLGYILLRVRSLLFPPCCAAAQMLPNPVPHCLALTLAIPAMLKDFPKTQVITSV